MLGERERVVLGDATISVFALRRECQDLWLNADHSHVLSLLPSLGSSSGLIKVTVIKLVWLAQ